MLSVCVVLNEKTRNSVNVRLYWKGNQFSSVRHRLIIRKLDIFSFITKWQPSHLVNYFTISNASISQLFASDLLCHQSHSG